MLSVLSNYNLNGSDMGHNRGYVYSASNKYNYLDIDMFDNTRLEEIDIDSAGYGLEITRKTKDVLIDVDILNFEDISISYELNIGQSDTLDFQNS